MVNKNVQNAKLHFKLKKIQFQGRHTNSFNMGLTWLIPSAVFLLNGQQEHIKMSNMQNIGLNSRKTSFFWHTQSLSSWFWLDIFQPLFVRRRINPLSLSNVNLRLHVLLFETGYLLEQVPLHFFIKVVFLA